LKSLDPAQTELLSLLNFQLHPQSLVGMLRLLPEAWTREGLQRTLQDLRELGWLEDNWTVVPSRQEQVARHAWRLGLPLPPLAELQEVRAPLLLRELRLALYGGDEQAFAYHWSRLRPDFWRPFDEAFVDGLEPGIARLLVEERLSQGDLAPEELDFLVHRPRLLGPAGRLAVAFQALLAGRFDNADSLLECREDPDGLACRAAALMLREEARQAVDLYAEGRTLLRKQTGRRKVTFSEPYGWLELLALLETGLPPEKMLLESLPATLKALWEVAQGRRVSLNWGPGRGLEGLFQALALAWQGRLRQDWEQELDRLEASGQHWLAEEYAALLGRDQPSRRSLFRLLPVHPDWQSALELRRQLREGEPG
jgi:hypothetical protein